MKKKKYHIECYSFKIIDCEDKSCKIKFDDEQGDAFKKERRKLYVIQDEKSILYVGEANCSIKERFQRASYSFNYYTRTYKARGGYKGYKWLNQALN